MFSWVADVSAWRACLGPLHPLARPSEVQGRLADRSTGASARWACLGPHRSLSPPEHAARAQRPVSSLSALLTITFFTSPVSSQFCASCSGASSALRAVLTALCFWTVLLMMLRCGSPQRLTLTHLLSGTGEQPMMLRSAASAMYLRFLGLFLRTLSSVSPRLSGPFSPADFSAALSRLWAGAF